MVFIRIASMRWFRITSMRRFKWVHKPYNFMIEKKISPKYLFSGLKNEFELTMVNEPLVFEPLRFDRVLYLYYLDTLFQKNSLWQCISGKVPCSFKAFFFFCLQKEHSLLSKLSLATDQTFVYHNHPIVTVPVSDDYIRLTFLQDFYIRDSFLPSDHNFLLQDARKWTRLLAYRL